ncbi:uncharacterized protein I303_101596 [Kwoniella dejecticola CBS 10117]|uniref:Uncharacterized protein n=1 Tax=Kwoniella dejecticola CBS 10117 TaxID=1296121 RepID=A0A1A6ADB0_9TREE|nr:uncharacterized protein I303_02270 [Kwoniella dejecticola CBS 10117]OBR88052.1 hypothetical protein I303_02270 [Kwoniella dejecticola CBS 10117]
MSKIKRLKTGMKPPEIDEAPPSSSSRSSRSHTTAPGRGKGPMPSQTPFSPSMLSAIHPSLRPDASNGSSAKGRSRTCPLASETTEASTRLLHARNRTRTLSVAFAKSILDFEAAQSVLDSAKQELQAAEKEAALSRLENQLNSAKEQLVRLQEYHEQEKLELEQKHGKHTRDIEAHHEAKLRDADTVNRVLEAGIIQLKAKFDASEQANEDFVNGLKDRMATLTSMWQAEIPRRGSELTAGDSAEERPLLKAECSTAYDLPGGLCTMCKDVFENQSGFCASEEDQGDGYEDGLHEDADFNECSEGEDEGMAEAEDFNESDEDIVDGHVEGYQEDDDYYEMPDDYGDAHEEGYEEEEDFHEEEEDAYSDDEITIGFRNSKPKTEHGDKGYYKLSQ